MSVTAAAAPSPAPARATGDVGSTPAAPICEWNWLTELILSRISNQAEYKSLIATASPKPLPVDPKIVAQRLRMTDSDIANGEKAGTLRATITSRLERIDQCVAILGKYQEEGDGSLTVRHSGQKTILTSQKLVRLFHQIYLDEFSNKETEALSTGNVQIVEKLFFYIKIEGKILHIVLSNPSDQNVLGKGGIAHVNKVFHVTLAVFQKFKYVSVSLPSKRPFDEKVKILKHEIAIANFIHASGEQKELHSAPSVVFELKVAGDTTVFGYCSNLYEGDLFDLLCRRVLSKLERLQICKMVVENCKKLWARKVLHCDHAPENFLFEQESKENVRLVLYDFGSARTDALRPPKPNIFRPLYVTQEEHKLFKVPFASEGEAKKADSKLEICLLGATLYQILGSTRENTTRINERFPFPLTSKAWQITGAVFDGEYLIQLGYPSIIVNLIEKMVDQNRARRLSIDTFLKEWDTFLDWTRRTESETKAASSAMSMPPSIMTVWGETANVLLQKMNHSDFPFFMQCLPAQILVPDPNSKNSKHKLLPLLELIAARYIERAHHEFHFLHIKSTNEKTLLTTSALMHLFHKLLNLTIPQGEAFTQKGLFLLVDGMRIFARLRKNGGLILLLLTGATILHQNKDTRVSRLLDIANGSYITFREVRNLEDQDLKKLMVHEFSILEELSKLQVEHFPQLVTHVQCSYKGQGIFGFGMNDCAETCENLMIRKSDQPFNRKFNLLVCEKIIRAVLKLWEFNALHQNLFLHNFLIKYISKEDFICVLSDFSGARTEHKRPILDMHDLSYLGPYDANHLQNLHQEKNGTGIAEMEQKIEMYQLGTTLYRVLSNNHFPYHMIQDKDGFTTPQNGAEFERGPLVAAGYTTELIDFVESMVNQNYQKRLGIKDFKCYWDSHFVTTPICISPPGSPLQIFVHAPGLTPRVKGEEMPVLDLEPPAKK